MKGLDYSIRNCNTPAQVKRYNPRGRVPALLIDGETYVDSTDILTELDRRVPDPPLEPDAPEERILCKVIEDWADEVLYFYGLYLRWCVPDGFARMKRHALSRTPIPIRWIVPTIARRVTRRRAMAETLRLNWKAGFVTGACSLLAYGIVIWAMTQAPIALVAALRETSVVLAAIIGALFLGERFGPIRWLAVILVAVGTVLMRL